jgi:hypothetical protein
MAGLMAGVGLGETATRFVAKYATSDPLRTGRLIALVTSVSIGTVLLATVVLISVSGLIPRMPRRHKSGSPSRSTYSSPSSKSGCTCRGHSMKTYRSSASRCASKCRPMTYLRKSTPTKIRPTRITKLICSINVGQLQVVPRGAENRRGKPTDNAMVESFNGKLREECLNAHWFELIEDAKRKIDAWRWDYTEHRPHRSLEGLTPREFAARANS